MSLLCMVISELRVVWLEQEGPLGSKSQMTTNVADDKEHNSITNCDYHKFYRIHPRANNIHYE